MIKESFGNEIGGSFRNEINNYRKKHNLPEPEEIKKAYSKTDTFLEEELSYVTKLYVTRKTLKYIDLFTNVETIIFGSDQHFSQLEIQEVLERYPNLKKLDISYQDRKIQTIDLSNNKLLEEVTITNNNGLWKVRGFEQLENLRFLDFYNNETYRDKEGLCNTVLELSKKTNIELDVLYYPIIDKIFKENYTKKTEFMNGAGRENLHFSETVGIETSHIKYQVSDMELLLKKVSEIIKKYIKDTDSLEEKYAIIYQWVCENVVYDTDSLSNDKGISMKNGKQIGKTGGTNGSYNGIMYGTCVCEGYTKMMQLFLEMVGIKSFNIDCVANSDSQNLIIENGIRKKNNIGNHSILRVILDGNCYYSDVTWDAGRYQRNIERKYFLLSQKEILKDHKLFDEDDVFSYAVYPKEKQDKLLEFAKNRIKQVNENEKKADSMINDMINNSNNNENTNTFKMGYIKVGVLGILALTISLVIIVLGVLLLR